MNVCPFVHRKRRHDLLNPIYLLILTLNSDHSKSAAHLASVVNASSPSSQDQPQDIQSKFDIDTNRALSPSLSNQGIQSRDYTSIIHSCISRDHDTKLLLANMQCIGSDRQYVLVDSYFVQYTTTRFFIARNMRSFSISIQLTGIS